MKKLWLPLVVVAIWLVFFVLGPWYSGGKIESEYDKILAHINSNGVIVAKRTSYEKGVFSAKTGLTISLNTDALGPAGQKLKALGSDLSLDFKGDVKHGPFLLDDGFSFAVGNIAFQPVFSEKHQAEITKLFGKTNPFALNMRMKWNHDVEFGGSVIPFKSPDGNVDSKTMTFGVTVSDNDHRRLTHANWGGATIIIPQKNNANGNIKIGNVTLTSDQNQAIEDLWVGNGAFDIDEITFSNKSQNKDGIFKKFHLVSVSSLDSNKEFLDTKVEFDLDKVTINKMDIVEGMKFVTSFNHFDAVSVQKLVKAIEDAQKAGGSQQAMQMAMGMQLMGILPEMVKKGFSINIENLDAKIMGSEVKSKLNIDVAAGTDVTKGMAAIAGVSASLDLTVAKELMFKLAKANPQMVDGLITQGLIAEKNGILTTHAEFKGGQLTVNGKPMPIPGLPAPQ